MKSFQKLRGAAAKKETMVTKKRIKNIPVQVSTFMDKGIKKYGLYIDGDKLDNYIYVTGEHKILVDNKKKDIEGFKPVSEVSYALKTDICDEELSCLITSNHRIPIGEYTFWDWED